MHHSKNRLPMSEMSLLGWATRQCSRCTLRVRRAGWPGNGRIRRILPASARPGEGHLAEPIADVQPARRKPLFMPLSGGWHCTGSAQGRK